MKLQVKVGPIISVLLFFPSLPDLIYSPAPTVPPPNKLGKGLKGILNVLLLANTITTLPSYTSQESQTHKQKVS